MEDHPPVLDYAAKKPRRRWIAKSIAFLMLAFGIFDVADALLRPPNMKYPADQKVADHNNHVRMLEGAVLTIPAFCLVLGFVRDVGDSDA